MVGSLNWVSKIMPDIRKIHKGFIYRKNLCTSGEYSIIFFLFTWGLYLLPLGLAGLLIIYLYTKWITRNPLICLIAPGLGFGPLMVVGTHFALTGQYSWTAVTASLIPFFLVNGLLLLNQFPDVEADLSIGRKHFPITIGRRKSSLIYIAFLLSTYLVLCTGVFTGYLPLPCLIGLITLIMVLPISRGVIQHAENTEKLIPYMGQNVIINIITPVLVAIGLLIV